MFKDETDGYRIQQFCGLRSKVYSFLIAEEHRGAFYGPTRASSKKLKGVPRRTVCTKLHHEDYIRCRRGEKIKSVMFRTIRSYRHQLYTVEQTKSSLNYYDDKRYILDGGVSTLPHGHCDIPREKP